MVPFQASATAGASQGDAGSGGLADIYFGSAFNVGRGSATSAQDRSTGPDLVTIVVIGVFSLIGLAIVFKAFRK